MTNDLLIQYIVFTIINVIIQTAKSIMTIKCNKYIASIMNAIGYGLNVYIVVLTMCDLPMFQKCVITALVNLVGVFIVKWVEERLEKTKLWKIEITAPTKYLKAILDEVPDMSFHYRVLGNKYTVFSFYCYTQDESVKVKKLVEKYEAKYFITEAKQEWL